MIRNGMRTCEAGLRGRPGSWVPWGFPTNWTDPTSRKQWAWAATITGASTVHRPTTVAEWSLSCSSSTTTTRSSTTSCNTSASWAPIPSCTATMRSMSPPSPSLTRTQSWISPGPGRPEDAGVSCAVIRELAGALPILGTCLGHQAIGHVYGGQVARAPSLMHGKTSTVHHHGVGVLRDLPQPFIATRRGREQPVLHLRPRRRAESLSRDDRLWCGRAAHHGKDGAQRHPGEEPGAVGRVQGRRGRVQRDPKADTPSTRCRSRLPSDGSCRRARASSCPRPPSTAAVLPPLDCSPSDVYALLTNPSLGLPAATGGEGHRGLQAEDRARNQSGSRSSRSASAASAPPSEGASRSGSPTCLAISTSTRPSSSVRT